MRIANGERAGIGCVRSRSLLPLSIAALALTACGSMNGNSGDARPDAVASGAAKAAISAGATSPAAILSGANPSAAIATGGKSSMAIASGDSARSAGIASGAAPAAAIAKNQKSIRGWVSCSGTSDDMVGAIKAFAAAKHGAFTLLVDCPVRLHSGLAIDRSIFIDNGTTVQFSGAGKFFVDNLFHPTFVIANSQDIALLDWNVEWDGSVPIDPNFGGYELNGRMIAAPGITQPAGAFNDQVLTPWLAANRSINFNQTQGWVKSVWIGGINPAAVFFLTGATSNVAFTGLKLYVPASAGGGQAFIPMAFSCSPNWKSDQTVTGRTPITGQYAAVPHGLTFSGLDLDGVLMGWQGSVQDTIFEDITSHRYGDLQDANGGHVGGIGKWFPPPHLFYLNTHSADPALFNSNLHFSNVVDDGIRLGAARDKGGLDSISGYANSLKLSCTDCSVAGYTSHRPDGFMDVLNSDNLTVSNVVATFDSGFINGLFPAGVRFPDKLYRHVTFENVHLTDTAVSTAAGPLGNATNPGNEGIVFRGVEIIMNRWAGENLPLPTISGAGNEIALNFTMTAQSTHVAYGLRGNLWVALEGTPAMLPAGDSATLTWTAREADRCNASGAWSGAVSGSGSRTVTVGAAGNYDYSLTCQNSSGSTSTALRVIAR